jgi:hypothetical protein
MSRLWSAGLRIRPLEVSVITEGTLLGSSHISARVSPSIVRCVVVGGDDDVDWRGVLLK